MKQVIVGMLLMVVFAGIVVSNVQFGSRQSTTIGQGGANSIQHVVNLATR